MAMTLRAPPLGRRPGITKLEATVQEIFSIDRGRPSHGSRDRTRALASEGAVPCRSLRISAADPGDRPLRVSPAPATRKNAKRVPRIGLPIGTAARGLFRCFPALD